MKKRIFSIVIAVILCFAMTVPVTILADDVSSNEPYWEKTVAVDGRKVTVTYKSANGAGVLCGGRVKMTYDPAVLTLNPEGTYTNVGATFGLGVINTQAGKFIANFAKATPITKDDILAVAVFDINEGQVCNKDTFKLELETLYDDIPADCGKLLVPLTFTCTHKNSTEEVTTPATCASEGVKTVTCSDCGEKTVTSIAKLSHEYDNGVVTTPATCAKEGVKTFTCKNCNATKTESIAKIDHVWNDGEVTTEPTETTAGVKTYTCKNCGATKEEKIDPSKPFDPETDTYWEKIVAVDGRKVTVTYKTKNGAGILCGGKVKMTYDPAVLTLNPEGTYTDVGATFGLGVINTQPGKFIANFAKVSPITKDDILAVAVFDINEGQVCNKDTFTLELEDLFDAIPDECGRKLVPLTFSCTHKNSTEEITTPATCASEGVKTVTCSDCGEKTVTSIAKLSHEYDNGVVTTPATCEKDGVKTFTCKNCNGTKTESVAALGHNEGEGVVTTPATCEKDGVKTFKCTRCDKVLKTEPIAKLGHDWDEGKITTPATCEENGVKTFTCKNCNGTKTESVAALGHNEGEGVVTTPATCEKDGVKTFKCTRCDKVLKTEPIAKLGHDWDEGKITTPATCEENGVKTFTCKNCNGTKTESVAALGHDLSDVKILKNPTCTEKGEKVGVCTRCQKEGVKEEIPALGHKWDEGKVTKEATVDAEGEKTYTCTVCHETKTEVLAKLAPEIIEGNNAVVSKSEIKALPFRSNAKFADFIRVEVDGKVIDASNYTLKEGSTIVTLNKDYVSTLSVGEHTLGIVSTNGTAVTQFTITAADGSSASANESPKTGDSSQVVIYEFAAIISLAVIAGIVYKKKISE